MLRIAGVLILVAVVALGLGVPSTLQGNIERFTRPQVPTAVPRVPAPSPTPDGRVAPAAQPNTVVSEVSVKPKPVLGTPQAKPTQTIVGLPARLTIPSIDVDAGFEFVALAADGAMDVPKDPFNVAWYRLGPRPGERGNAVVAGHVDWGGKIAVFWRLRDLQPGNEIQVTTADDKHLTFVVRSVRWYNADKAPVSEVFSQTDATELTLITCGGDFDRSTRQYLSRLVVRAVLR